MLHSHNRHIYQLPDDGTDPGTTGGEDPPKNEDPQKKGLLDLEGDDDPPADEDPPSKGDEKDPPDNKKKFSDPIDPMGELDEYKDKDGKYLGKYDSLKDALDGYKELSKKVREKKPEPPEAYESITFDEKDEKLPELMRGYTVDVDNDPLFKHMTPFFKEAELDQKQVAIIAKGATEYNLSQVESEADIKKNLGSNADQIVADVNAWAKKNIKEKELAQVVYRLGGSSGGMKLLHYVSRLSQSTEPPGRAGEAGAATSSAELYSKAREYKKEHADTIEIDRHQQNVYDKMMKDAAALELKGL